MKRRNFLLSIPLLGLAAKAFTNSHKAKTEQFDYLLKKGEEGSVLTLMGGIPEWVPIGTVKSVKKLGYKKYQVDVEMVMNHSMILNGVNFKNGGYAIVREHSIVGLSKHGEVLIVPSTVDPKNVKHIHRLTLYSHKKKFIVGIGELMIISYSAFPA